MNKIRNQVRLIGNVGAIPVLKTLENGSKRARFSLATNEHFKDKDGNNQSKTEWHNIVAWGRVAELAEDLLDKGKEIALEGKLTSRSYESDNGETKYITEIVMNEFALLGKKAS